MHKMEQPVCNRRYQLGGCLAD